MLHIHIATQDLQIALAGLIVGLIVGLTGMGGGALMTPILVLVFKIQPLAAVSSDLVSSLVMKPFGTAVHFRRRTIKWDLVKWLCIGSVPSAFLGVVVLRMLGNSKGVQNVVQTSLGAVLLLSAAALVLKALLNLRSRARGEHLVDDDPPVVVKPLPTLVVGVIGGLVVGMTSVGSGSLIICSLLLMYPKLKANRLVGTDLVQSIPLTAAAAGGHLLFGGVQFGLTAALIVGSIPGVLIGAQFSSRANGRVVRRALAFVLLASGLKLLDLSVPTVGLVMGVAFVVGPVLWMGVKRTDGYLRKPAPVSADTPVAA